MPTQSDHIIAANPTERGYSEGWHAYHNGQAINSNPFNPDDETAKYEGFQDGWTSAAAEDSDKEDA